mmetsp:Transcript_8726/g.14493  ORF Transcript_8726/g.14493 Transcript_8726/m.14493 type:complete len:307 (-) Transcript_8726:376-1296(-)
MDATSSTSSSTSTTTVAAAAGSPVGTGTGTDSGVYARIPVAFVGDAAHTLDPILAQGAGIAVEDAMHLRNAILEVLPAASPNAWNAATDGNATTTTTTGSQYEYRNAGCSARPSLHVTSTRTSITYLHVYAALLVMTVAGKLLSLCQALYYIVVQLAWWSVVPLVMDLIVLSIVLPAFYATYTLWRLLIPPRHGVSSSSSSSSSCAAAAPAAGDGGDDGRLITYSYRTSTYGPTTKSSPARVRVLPVVHSNTSKRSDGDGGSGSSGDGDRYDGNNPNPTTITSSRSSRCVVEKEDKEDKEEEEDKE